MLYFIYTIILIYITVVMFIEFFKERDWKKQVAVAIVLIIFVLRIFQIK